MAKRRKKFKIIPMPEEIPGLFLPGHKVITTYAEGLNHPKYMPPVVR